MRLEILGVAFIFNRLWHRLTQHLFGCVRVFRADLKAHATNKIGDLLIQSNQIFIAKETEYPRRLNHRSHHDRFRYIPIASHGYESSTGHRVGDIFFNQRRFDVPPSKLRA